MQIIIFFVKKIKNTGSAHLWPPYNALPCRYGPQLYNMLEALVQANINIDTDIESFSDVDFILR